MKPEELRDLRYRIGDHVVKHFIEGDALINDQPKSPFFISGIHPNMPYGQEYGLSITSVSFVVGIKAGTDEARELSLQEVGIVVNPLLQRDSGVELVVERNMQRYAAIAVVYDPSAYFSKLDRFTDMIREKGCSWSPVDLVKSGAFTHSLHETARLLALYAPKLSAKIESLFG